MVIMHWFEGAITAAISEAKQRRVLFVVYIHGDDDESKKMNDMWEDTAVVNVRDATQFVAMRFHSSSEECKQFSQYYPVLCVPSVSLISGNTGVLLEGMAGYTKPEEFVQKIKSVQQTLKEQTSGSQIPNSPTASAAGSTSVGTSKAAVPGKAGGGAQVTPPPPQTATGKEEENLQERASRLRQKMEAIHQQKESQKQQEKRKQEMERRTMGQNVQKAQQKRAGQELMDAAEELRKKKLEDRLAKERVKQQIAMDREEKKARFDTERKEREQIKATKEAVTESEKTVEQKAKAKVNMETARLQFRLPDGSAVTQSFPASSPLQEAHDFLAQDVGSALKEFTFSTTFPRRHFAASDLSRSLLDLELAPSAALVVLPGRPKSSKASTTVVPSSGGGDSMFMWIFAPLLFIWNAFYNFLFGSSSSSPSNASSQEAQQQESSLLNPTSPQTEEHSQQSPSPTGARPKSSNVRRRTPGNDGANYKKEGNIHRLVTNSDDDEENNTWNGNSTQQM